MWELAKESMLLFLRGKLFASPRDAFGLMALGLGVTAVGFVAAVKLGAPIGIAAPVTAFLGGVLQPRLYKNLKYK